MTKEITGRQFKIALKKAAAWHTPVACGVGDGILIRSDGIKVAKGQELDDSAGQPWITDIDNGVNTSAGTIDAYMRYDGMDLLLAMVMGISAAPAQIDATAAYTNTYGLATDLTGLFVTMAEQKLTDKVWEFPSVKAHGFKLSGEMNKPCILVVDMIADKMVRDSLVNTVATMADVTALKENRILMDKNTVFRINDRDGIALAAGDIVNPASFELTVSRPMDSESVAGQDGVAEPDDNGFPTISLMLKFPRYNAQNDAFFDDWEALTPKKMDITFTGKLIEGGNYYTFQLLFSHGRVSDPEAPVAGAGKIPFSMKLDCIGATVAPLGMIDLTAPMQIKVTNTRDTNPLA
jgi:hypothetical protein